MEGRGRAGGWAPPPRTRGRGAPGRAPLAAPRAAPPPRPRAPSLPRRAGSAACWRRGGPGSAASPDLGAAASRWGAHGPPAGEVPGTSEPRPGTAGKVAGRRRPPKLWLPRGLLGPGAPRPRPARCPPSPPAPGRGLRAASVRSPRLPLPGLRSCKLEGAGGVREGSREPWTGFPSEAAGLLPWPPGGGRSPRVVPGAWGSVNLGFSLTRVRECSSRTSPQPAARGWPSLLRLSVLPERKQAPP